MSTTAAGGARAADSTPDSTNGHGHRHLGLALFVIATAQLMVVLDSSIVNIAIPSIQTALDFTPTNLTWVINAYTLAFGGLLLLGGRAGDLFGRRRVFVIGVLLFTVASLLCGLAWSEASLISFRVLQGAGAAIAAPTALALITTTFPEGPPRNRAFAVYAAMSGAGAAVGLIAGGLLTDLLGWRWVFFVNVPIGLLIAWAAPRVLGESSPKTGRIDFAGAITGTVGLTVLVYGITRAGNPATGWGDSITLLCFAAALVLLAVFLLIESRHGQPIMPLRLFAERNRSASYLVMLIVGAALFSMFYFISLFVQGILQYSPVRAGLAFLPFTAGIVIGAGFASQLAPRQPPRVIAGVGLALSTVGLFLYTRLDAGSSYVSDLLIPMLIISIGMGLAFVSFTLTAVSGVAEHESGIASGLLNTMQQIGGSLGLAVLATIAASTTTTRFPQADAVGAQQQAFARQTPGVEAPDPALLGQAADALTHGYATAFGVGAAMMLASLILTLVLINAPKQAPVDTPQVHVG